MEKNIENAISKEVVVMGLTNFDMIFIIMLFCLGIPFLPIFITFTLVITLWAILYRINKTGKRFFLKSLIINLRTPKKLKMKRGSIPLEPFLKDKK